MTSSAAVSRRRARARASAAARLVSRWTAPHADGLPSWRVLVAFPLLLVVVGLVLVASGLNGTSSGILRDGIEAGPDPRLVAGSPQLIRSDEYNVQTVWAVSQESQDFPDRNQVLPGGLDATVQNDLPSRDWSMAFRPHLAPMLVLPLDQGIALRWWLPVLVMVGAAYVLAVTLMPRRPVTSAALAVGFAASPFFQWWFLPITFWPVAWAFTSIAAAVWCLRSRRRVRWALSAAAGYLTVTMVMGVYVPFIVPCFFVVLAVVVGLTAERGPGRDAASFPARARRLLPLTAFGLAGAAVAGVWVATRLDTVRGLLDTVYPGQRSQVTGAMGLPGVTGALSAPFSRAFETNQTTGLGLNASEAASFALVGLFAAGTLCWYVADAWRRERRVEGAAVGLVLVVGLFLAFALVPGWDSVARLLALDRVKMDRIRMGLGVASFTALVLVGHLHSRTARRPSASWAVVAGVVAASSVAVVYASLKTGSPETLGAAVAWPLLAVGIVLAAALAGHARTGAAALVLLVVSVPVAASVNPVYVGLYDLRATAVGRAVADAERAGGGTWVGVGPSKTSNFLVEQGVRAYNGTQTVPPREMWADIDPDSSDEQVWNRLAAVTWTPGTGEPQLSNPASDQISATFDSCSAFARQHVDLVLSDGPLDQPCLSEVESVPVASGGTYVVYRVGAPQR